VVATPRERRRDEPLPKFLNRLSFGTTPSHFFLSYKPCSKWAWRLLRESPTSSADDPGKACLDLVVSALLVFVGRPAPSGAATQPADDCSGTLLANIELHADGNMPIRF
jgi:hypothetical protein